jgi:hypothetical protein
MTGFLPVFFSLVFFDGRLSNRGALFLAELRRAYVNTIINQQIVIGIPLQNFGGMMGVEGQRSSTLHYIYISKIIDCSLKNISCQKPSLATFTSYWISDVVIPW